MKGKSNDPIRSQTVAILSLYLVLIALAALSGVRGSSNNLTPIAFAAAVGMQPCSPSPFCSKWTGRIWLSYKTDFYVKKETDLA